MTFGQQPQNNGQYNPQYNTPDYNAAQQSGYGQQYAQSGYGQNYYAQPQGAPTYQYVPQGTGAGAGAATINTTMTYNYEEARRVSVTKVYGEMTIGILVTAVVAVLGQITGAYYSFLMATGMVGLIGLCVVQIALAVVLGMRVTKMKSATARVMFYVYAASMGFTLSSIFMVYDLGSIGVALGVTAAFFFALTMFGMTTKFNMLKAGPILMIGLIVLIISQIVLAFVQVDGMTKIVCAIGLILFAGMTIYDAQSDARAADRIRGPGPGNGQEDLHPVRPEPVPRLREHVPVHPAAARQQGLASTADWRAACSLPVKRHSPTTLWPGFFMSVTFAR